MGQTCLGEFSCSEGGWPSPWSSERSRTTSVGPSDVGYGEVELAFKSRNNAAGSVEVPTEWLQKAKAKVDRKMAVVNNIVDETSGCR